MEQHPESGAVQLNISEDKIHEVVGYVDEAISHRSEWENRCEEWYKKRYGMREKKDFPWPGSSNINLPLTDKVIRHQKPVFVNAVFGMNPVVSIEPLGDADPERARRIESFYDWLLRYRMNRCREAQIHSIDCFLTYGQSYMKCIWEHKTERVTRKLDLSGMELDREAVTEEDMIPVAQQMGVINNSPDDVMAFQSMFNQFKSGKDKIEVSIQQTKYNAPRWVFVDPRDIVVPWDSLDEIDDLPWIAHRMFLKPSAIKERGVNGMYDRAGAFQVAEEERASDRLRTDGVLDQLKDTREGTLQSGESSFVEIYEIYFHHDINGDGIPEKCVMTISPRSNTVLRLIQYPYEHGMWPFTRFTHEMSEPRWYSPRGIPEMLNDIQTEINAQHNAKLDRMSIQNSLTFLVREGSIRNSSNLRFRPGSYIPVRRMDDVKPLTMQPLDFSFDNEERTLKAYAEEYVGITDFGLSNVNQRVERRTATEVSEIARISDMVANLDLQIFQESMRRLHRQTIFLWAQYGDMSVMLSVEGRPDPIVFDRFDLYKDFDLVPTGTLDNISSRSRVNKAMTDMQIASNPMFSQYINHYELLRDYFENSDFRSSKRLLRGPGLFEEDAAQRQVSEIQLMQTMKMVAPVDQSDPHQLHIPVLEQAIQANADDPELTLLLMGHMALHMAMMGDASILQQLQQQGAQVTNQGSRMYMILPELPEEGGMGGSQPVGADPRLEGGNIDDPESRGPREGDSPSV